MPRYRKLYDEDGNEIIVEEKLKGEELEEFGDALQGCGCLLTLFVTIPILLILAGLF
ncbi:MULTISPECIES: hypothetical protein [Aerococcus]|uniref:hypothetical protein n=1 Tax=Aerococcus TaxID=1375 RepID=UPI0015EC2A08|nr:hypothetical protein [Aerococcus urinae]MDK6597884.1 hypothetical protein [Aerococcus urinae]MDK7303285.1 hypothetical protein [Aerococcus urinae]MDK7802548.1 hypothetical protein [Aerococcus urinae]MDK8656074.1 hypothetical protein [Aerococcus urinae]